MGDNKDYSYEAINNFQDYNKLLNTGLFRKFYPNLSGVWEQDKDIVYKANVLPKPEPLKVFNTVGYGNMCKLCKNYINFIDDDENYTEDNDFKQYIFEAALEIVYGKNIWDYVNNRQN